MEADKFSTPMMKQYLSIKKQYPDCLLFFRLGDFYELFMEDAKIGAKILGIALTSRHKGKDGRVPMAGVPYHAVDSYLAKLVKAGYKVAICEQTSEPDGSGIVDREVVRIATPGTVLDEKALEQKENNYLVSISINSKNLGIAIADLSTGDFQGLQLPLGNLEDLLINELVRFNPSECILPENLYTNPQIIKILKASSNLNIYCFYEWEKFTDNGEKLLKEHFKVKTLKGFGIENKEAAIEAAAALLGYLKYTQKDKIAHLKKIRSFLPGDYVCLDRSTILNLELFSTIREGDKKGSLIQILDQTITAMGGRLLRRWLYYPLTNKEKIDQRLLAVEEFLNNGHSINALRNSLKNIVDIERLLSRLSAGLGNGRDLVNLKASLSFAMQIKQDIKSSKSKLIKDIYQNINPEIQQVIKLINDTILGEPPIDIKQGGIIKPGVQKELDDLRQKAGGGKTWITRLENQERQRTGINSLKVRFNRVFGYYIEISKANLKLTPENYIRKQTLVNAERFITPELKEYEELVLTAEDKINQLEYKIFIEVVDKILEKLILLQQTSSQISILDCLLSFAYLAETEIYCKPEITTSGEIIIKDGRHPVVEKLLEENQFVPNDIVLDRNNQLFIITGPNMAGKSVFIRQIALIVLLAQIGSFVPANSAQISLVDRIFVRSGASDAVAFGLSTFMVEMIETAYILNHATQNSLIIMDEIGRGTSTYDGISIAWAVAEYLVSNPKNNPKTLFATHYHELQALAEKSPVIKNYQIAVEEKDGKPIFLHKVKPGGASHSYGIAVAQLAGVPDEVISRAIEILATLEKRQLKTPIKIQDQSAEQLALIQYRQHPVIEQLKKLKINSITPLEALKRLAKLQKSL